MATMPSSDPTMMEVDDQDHHNNNNYDNGNHNNHSNNNSMITDNPNHVDITGKIQDEVWIGKILPFAGMGSYAVVAPVSRKFRKLCMDFCEQVPMEKRPRKLDSRRYCLMRDEPLPLVEPCDTFDPVFLGSLSNMLYFMKMDPEYFRNSARYMAAEIGNLALLQWVQDPYNKNCLPADSETYIFAAESGQLHILKWLRQLEQDRSLPGDCLRAAAAFGHLEVCQWVLDNGRPGEMVIDLAVTRAAHFGQLHILDWFRGIGCEMGRVSYQAARLGNLKLLEYVRDHALGWDWFTCRLAGESGHFKCLEFLHENGCPWDNYTIRYADNFKVVKYALENGCPWDRKDIQVFLFRQGYYLPVDLALRADIVRWLQEKWA